jgi:hypothetical protein
VQSLKLKFLISLFLAHVRHPSVELILQRGTDVQGNVLFLLVQDLVRLVEVLLVTVVTTLLQDMSRTVEEEDPLPDGTRIGHLALVRQLFVVLKNVVLQGDGRHPTREAELRTEEGLLEVFLHRLDGHAREVGHALTPDRTRHILVQEADLAAIVVVLAPLGLAHAARLEVKVAVE